MNAKCHQCSKTVYPVEKLNCLDKIWHKGCFRCEVCKMTLSMKSYKGYNKLPYCNTHYPTTKFTPVADTPENLRLKKNTNQQSSAVYHKEFEQEKGKVIAVADDPETLRTRKTQQQASLVNYQQKVMLDPTEAGRRQYQEPEPPTGAAPPPPVEYEPAPEEAAPSNPSSGGVRYQAMYDYEAADEDEVSFNDGDVIINIEQIDEGWMTGTVEKTGQTGMLPSNYVEPIS